MKVSTALRFEGNQLSISVLGAFLFILLHLAMTVVTVTGATVAFSSFLSEEWIDLLTSTVTMAMVVTLIVILNSEMKGNALFARPDKRVILWLVVLLLPLKLYASIPVAALTKLFEWLPFVPQSFLDNDLTSVTWDTWLSYCVLAPLEEEFLYRALIGAGLIRWYGEKKGILFSALFFALVHLNPISVVHAFILGLVLQWIFARTNNLLYSILLHSLLNFIAVIASTETVDDWVSTQPDTLWYVSGALLLIGGALFWKERQTLGAAIEKKTEPSDQAVVA